MANVCLSETKPNSRKNRSPVLIEHCEYNTYSSWDIEETEIV